MRLRPFRGNLFCLAWILLGQVLLSLFIAPEAGVDGFVTVPAEVAFAVITAAVKLKLILVKVLFALRTIGLLRNRHSQRHKRSISTTDLESNSNDLHMNEIIGDNQADILAAWEQLEAAAHQNLDFDLSYCRLGVLAPNSVGHAPQKQLREYLEAEGDRSSQRRRRRRKRSVQQVEGADAGDWEDKADSTENLLLFFDSKEDTDNHSDESDERHYELVYDDDEGVLVDDYDLDNNPTGPETKVEDSRTIEVSYSEFVSATIGSMMGDMHGCEILERGLN